MKKFKNNKNFIFLELIKVLGVTSVFAATIIPKSISIVNTISNPTSQYEMPKITLMENSSSSNNSFITNNNVLLYGWGLDDISQLGDNGNINKNKPENISSITGIHFFKIVSGRTHTLAIDSKGELYAWGDNQCGQLGDGSIISRTTPIKINLPNGVKPKKIAVGNDFSMATGTDNNLYVWGCNKDGQLGDATRTNKTIPTKVTLPKGVDPTQIACGINTAMTIGTDNELYIWGNNIYLPTKVTLGDGIYPKEIACGGNHEMIIGTDNELYAFGKNNCGQLGDGTTIDKINPIKISLSDGVYPKEIACGMDYSMVIGSDNNLYTWGDNQYGQLGDGSTTNRLFPTKITLESEEKPKHITCGSYFSIMLSQNDDLYTWGDNQYGQLGDGTFVNKLIPSKINNNL